MSPYLDKAILAQISVVPRLYGRVVDRAADWLSRSIAKLRRRRDRAAAFRALMKLDDRLLDDAGLARHELRALIESRLGQP
ncbi:MAG: hypothetical protein QOK29_1769 [Rhodospirillaceae bacterium]|jgi:uncharacterized protein YjiS (DUF1127 family)|nr:hypothetical protein [Rhodospirillaceae bacterium]